MNDGKRLASLSVINDDEYEFTIVGDDGTEVTRVLTKQSKKTLIHMLMLDEKEDNPTNNYQSLLEELNDVLEGGDVSLDFEDSPAAATTIRIISDIVGNALRGIKSIEELQKMLDRVIK